jgi:hypothetical protein
MVVSVFSILNVLVFESDFAIILVVQPLNFFDK